MKTIEELRERKKFLLNRKAYELSLQEQGNGDNMALFFVEEELRDINAQIRDLEPRYRVGRSRVTHNAFAADRHQYTEWTRQDGEDNSRERAAMYQAVEQADDVLTEKQRQVFALWRSGMTMESIGKELGVTKSTVSRSIARSKKAIRENMEISGAIRQTGDLAVLDASDPDTATAVLSCVTAKQAVCMYLYYGEGLSLGKVSLLVGVDRSAVLRLIRRGLANISKTLGYQHVELENLEALGDLAYNLYFEGFEPPEDVAVERVGRDWGRAALGEKPKHSASGETEDRPITVVARRNHPAQPGKLLLILRKRRDKNWLYRCLAALFTRMTQNAAKRRRRASC